MAQENKIVDVRIIGAGGLLYHCLPSLATVLNGYREPGTDLAVTVVDPDTVEKPNTMRQWAKVGHEKAGLALDMFDDLLSRSRGRVSVANIPEKVAPVDLWDRGGPHAVETLVVVCLPDNHLCRAQVHKELATVVAPGHPEVQVWGLYAGNTGEAGWGYACRYQKDGVAWDWGPRHLDIVQEALAEWRHETEGVSCGRAPEAAEGQTLRSNQMTGLLVTGALMDILVWQEGGERYWVQEQENRAIVYHKPGNPEVNKDLGYLMDVPDLGTTAEEQEEERREEVGRVEAA